MSHKITFSLVAVSAAALLLFSFAASAFAQTLPEVYVSNVSLEKQIYSPSETVVGTATLFNDGSAGVSNVSYVVRLVGSYGEDTLPTREYTQWNFDPVFLGAGDEQEVSFAVKLPLLVFEPDLGIEVQAVLEEGTPLGWNDSRILVRGAEEAVRFAGAYILVQDPEDEELQTPYELENGPTIHDGEEIFLFFILSNETANTSTLTPSVSIYPRFVGNGEPIHSEKLESITLEPGTSSLQGVPLPKFDGTADVYTGTLRMLDEAGNTVVETIDFRYIISGDIVRIHSVSADREALIPDEQITVTAIVSGAPFDISRDEQPLMDGVDLQVRLFNEKDDEIAVSNAPLDLNTETEKTLTLTAAKGAKGLRAEVVIARGEEVLARKDAILSGNYQALQKEAGEELPTMMIVGIGALVLIVIIGIVLYIARPKKGDSGKDDDATPTNNEPNPNITTLSILLFGLLVGGAVVFTNPSVVDAFTITNTCWNNCTHRVGPTLFINTPSGTLAPGEQFYVTGTTRALQCSNVPHNILLQASFGGVTKNQSRGGGVDPAAAANRICIFGGCFAIDWSVLGIERPKPNPVAVNNYARTISITYDVPWNSRWSHRTDRFSIGPFTAPTEPGTFRVNIGSSWWSHFKDGFVRGGTFGFQEFTVEGTGEPDLIANTPEVFSGNLVTGQSVVFAGTVTNQGVGDVVNSFTNEIQIDLGNDGSFETALATSPTIAQMNAGKGQPVTATPWTAAVGTHAARFCADSGNAVTESNEDNNCSATTLVFTVSATAQCSDGIDNDGNGQIDYPEDAGCTSAGDGSEAPTQCSDGIDNDNDGNIDYPNDASCSSADDDAENSSDDGQAPDAALSLSATPSLTRAGNTVTLQWSAENVVADSCSLTGSNGDSWTVSGTSGSQVSSVLQSQTTFTLSCTAAKDDKPIATNTTVKLVPQFEEE